MSYSKPVKQSDQLVGYVHKLSPLKKGTQKMWFTLYDLVNLQEQPATTQQ